MEHPETAGDTSKIQETMTMILTSAISELTKTYSATATAGGETRILFPEGINFISLAVTLNPAKAELVVSSKPIGKASITDGIEPVNQGAEQANLNSNSPEE